MSVDLWTMRNVANVKMLPMPIFNSNVEELVGVLIGRGRVFSGSLELEWENG